MVRGNVETRAPAGICPDTLADAHGAAQTVCTASGSGYELWLDFLGRSGLSC